MQIKRAEATVTHLESEPAACPYCMEPDFGVIYEVQKVSMNLFSMQIKSKGIIAFAADCETRVANTYIDGFR